MSKAKLPEGWEEVELSEYIELVGGFAFSSNDFIKKSETAPPLIKIGELQGGKIDLSPKTSYLPEKFYNKYSESRLTTGDVLIAMSGATTGKIAVVQEGINKALLNQRVGLFKITCPERVSTNFFYHYAQSKNFKLSIQRNIGQSAQGNISPKNIKKIKVIFPPKLEQKAIAKVLSTVDEDIEKVNGAIKKTLRLKKGLMNIIFELNKWEKATLSDTRYFEINMGQSPPSASYSTQDAGIPFLQGNAEFGKLYPTPSKNTKNPIKIANEGDILISVRAPVGALNLCNQKVCIGRGLGAITVKQGNNMFYFYFLKYINNKIKNLSQGSTFKAITKNEMDKIKVPILAPKEQETIANNLSTIDKKLNLLDQKKTKLQQIKKGLMNDLLTGKKRLKGFENGKIQ